MELFSVNINTNFNYYNTNITFNLTFSFLPTNINPAKSFESTLQNIANTANHYMPMFALFKNANNISTENDSGNDITLPLKIS